MNYQNSPVFIIIFSILFIIAILVLTIVFIIKSRKKIFEKEIEKKNLEIAYQKQNTLSIIEAQENERKRIAQDLHDDVSSKLIALSLNLHLLKSKKTPEAEKESIFSTLESINSTAIETSRKIAHNLFPPILEKFGLQEAIEEIVLDFNSSRQINIKYKSEVNFSFFEKEKQLHVFRIIQELINNSIKHGKASEINILFKNENKNIEVSYQDNGVGLIKEKFNKNKGLGFINIESRITAINGNYVIDFTKQDGFALTIHF
ncbi:sensor histidine kinase [Flavobacterium sp.]|uniref:sensor histidine kinase n=1 Tax=Flavobacterium sp. TaxID=239 RepID=UPI00374D518C